MTTTAPALGQVAPPTPTALDRRFAVVAGTVEGQALAAASMRSVDPQRVEVWTVPGAAHVQGLGAAPDKWERCVVGFLDTSSGHRDDLPKASPKADCSVRTVVLPDLAVAVLKSTVQPS